MRKKKSVCKLLYGGSLFLFLQFFLAISTLGSTLYAQQNRIISVNLKQTTLSNVLEHLTNVMGCKILYNHEQVKSQRQFDLKMQEKPLEEVIKKCLENTNLVYKIVDDVFVITPKSTTSKEDEKKAKEITGVVVDVKGDSIPGVTVTIKGTTIGTSTDANGLFKMTIPANLKEVSLVFSFIGMESQ